ncbi:uncharacterized protein PV06_05157 [Exophiala oligosperma]|uniref:Dienelactone hydrolase domain-containing protein n=1 Tax=Exophiala oligosperma TaxID=215243 RepID=A0A0D2DME3_9EURO|nr:uncharacterized protein PV06_05157 [Exophiala oligosperma]KIW44123.1 hypothetical protein PV06_05157 [Exophiala oligosperma]
MLPDAILLMPDFFGPNPADVKLFPPRNPEETAAVWEWFKTYATPDMHLPKIPGLLASAKDKYPSVDGDRWGIMGYCWGGKMSSLLAVQQAQAQASTTGDHATQGQKPPQFKISVIVQAHPGLIDPSEAAEIGIPVCMLPSMDENADEVARYDANLTKAPKHVEIFPDQIHGWMSARADLSDQRVKDEYQRAYGIAGEWFKKYL